MPYQPFKRLMDVFIALVGIVSFSPLIVLLCLAIYLEDRGSPFYNQIRIGKDRRPFRLLKLRSMVINADEILFNDLEFLKKLRTGANKLEDDPRITRVGKLIRKYSLDELPQFFNVLEGSMSVIGPRAYRPDELDDFEAKHLEARDEIEAILSVRPGITGLWQVTGRSKISFDERVAIEARYGRSCSLALDLWIMFRTPGVVLKGEGF